MMDEEFYDAQFQADIYSTFYAIQFTKQLSDSADSQTRIYLIKKNAFDFLKQYPKDTRVKSFKSLLDAYRFSYGYGNEAVVGQKSVADGVKQLASKYKKPKQYDLNRLRLNIERGQIDEFKEKIESNPRYLINSNGYTPVVIQGSFHYNCLHICAKYDQREACQFILNRLSSIDYIRQLYGSSMSNEQLVELSTRLLDMYLNTPELGLYETPLHFACKFGSYEVCKLLLAQDKCLKHVRNRNKQKPLDVVCAKVDDPNKTAQIKSLLLKRPKVDPITNKNEMMCQWTMEQDQIEILIIIIFHIKFHRL